jgi:hypothetical protein
MARSNACADPAIKASGGMGGNSGGTKARTVSPSVVVSIYVPNGFRFIPFDPELNDLTSRPS